MKLSCTQFELRCTTACTGGGPGCGGAEAANIYYMYTFAYKFLASRARNITQFWATAILDLFCLVIVCSKNGFLFFDINTSKYL